MSASELVEPESAEQAATIFRDASHAGARVCISANQDTEHRTGAGTQADIRVSAARLNRVIEHEATDLTCIVEPGLRLSELDEALTLHQQRLALDPPGDPTIGACIAEALSGPRRHRYGAVRDLILGVTVVLPDGTIASSGGKVVKNVAGYDLAKLFCGSGGSLGLVVRAAFRLHPRPEMTSTFAVPAGRSADAQSLVGRLTRSKLVLGALDLHWPDRLLGLVEGSARVVSAQLIEASRLVGAAEVTNDAWNESHARQTAAAAVRAFSPSELGDVLRTEAPNLVRPSLGIAYSGTAVVEPTSAALRQLHERIREQFDPGGVLVA